MQRYFLITLIIIIVFAIFAVSNTQPVKINLLFTRIESSLAITILVVFALGAIISLLVSTPTILKHKKDARRKGKEIKGLKDKVEKLERQDARTSSTPSEIGDDKQEESSEQDRSSGDKNRDPS